MIKTVFSILIGIFLAICTLLLVGIYWLVGLIARVIAILLLPFRMLLGKSGKS